MSRTDRLAQVDRALRSAAAHAVAHTLIDILGTDADIADAEVYLADYRQSTLEALVRPERSGIPVIGSAAGAAYREQHPVRESRGDDSTRSTLFLPVSLRGIRIGVLAVEFPGEPDAARQEELTEVANQLGHAITAAEPATDTYLRARRQHRLTLAAEMQWDLLPGCTLEYERFTLAGQLEPAYSVHGDNFDWSADRDSLSIALTNGQGDGLTAVLLTTLAIQAVRNARRAGLGLADQAALADQALWSHYGGREFVETLLLRFELGSGRVLAVDAGSPRLWRLRGTEVSTISLDQQLPLGLADGTVYVEQEFTVEPGDRVLMLSDGVFDAATDGARYDTVALARCIRHARLLPPAEAVRAILSDLRVFRRERELDDDAVAVCLDWNHAGR